MTQTATIPAPKHLPDAQTVTAVRHWNDRLFSFRVTRPQTLRFRSGEFVMIGLMDDKGKPLLRAYSIASPSWDEELEFYSIKVPDGPLTSRLQHIQPGDEIILRPKPVGTLVVDALLPGKHLWFLATAVVFSLAVLNQMSAKKDEKGISSLLSGRKSSSWFPRMSFHGSGYYPRKSSRKK